MLDQAQIEGFKDGSKEEMAQKNEVDSEMTTKHSPGLQDFQKEANPATVIELLDHLEAAESDCLEQARLNGMGSERDALRAKVSDLTINVEYLSNLKKSYEELIGGLQDERDALRAKIERMDAALESLLIRCDDADFDMYGILSTSFVRDTVRIAKGEQE